MSPESVYMDSKEVSSFFRVDDRTVRAMAAAGLLPGIQFGKVWRFPRERISKIAAKLPKTDLEDYEVENTLIIWFHAEKRAPTGFDKTLNEHFRSILDRKAIEKYYDRHKITPHQPERSYRKPDRQRIVDNSARSASGKQFDQQ